MTHPDTEMPRWLLATLDGIFQILDLANHIGRGKGGLLNHIAHCPEAVSVLDAIDIGFSRGQLRREVEHPVLLSWGELTVQLLGTIQHERGTGQRARICLVDPQGSCPVDQDIGKSVGLDYLAAVFPSYEILRFWSPNHLELRIQFVKIVIQNLDVPSLKGCRHVGQDFIRNGGRSPERHMLLGTTGAGRELPGAIPVIFLIADDPSLSWTSGSQVKPPRGKEI